MWKPRRFLLRRWLCMCLDNSIYTRVRRALNPHPRFQWLCWTRTTPSSHSGGLDTDDLETTLIPILTLLRPKNLSCDNGPNHHITHEKVHQQQRENSHTPNDIDGFAGKCFADSKRGGDQSGVGEDEREPGHREDHSTMSDGRPMRRTGDDEEEYR